MKNKRYRNIGERGAIILLMVVVLSAVFYVGCGNRQAEQVSSSEGEMAYVGKEGMPYREVDVPTPNKGEGKNTVEGVVLHHTAEDSVDKALSILTNPEKGVSCHVLIDKDGTRYVLASPETVTWHAGKSWFNGKENANNTTVGIEFQGNTLEEPLTDDQIRSAIEYLRPVMKKYDIPSDRIVTHEQIRQEWKRRHPKSNVPDKRDITPDEYSRFINALNDSIANGSWNDTHKK